MSSLAPPANSQHKEFSAKIKKNHSGVFPLDSLWELGRQLEKHESLSGCDPDGATSDIASTWIVHSVPGRMEISDKFCQGDPPVESRVSERPPLVSKVLLSEESRCGWIQFCSQICSTINVKGYIGATDLLYNIVLQG